MLSLPYNLLKPALNNIILNILILILPFQLKLLFGVVVDLDELIVLSCDTEFNFWNFVFILEKFDT